MNLEFLNPEYFILFGIIPLIILWNYYKSDKLSNSLKFSNSSGFGKSNNLYSGFKSLLKFLRISDIDYFFFSQTSSY